MINPKREYDVEKLSMITRSKSRKSGQIPPDVFGRDRPTSSPNRSRYNKRKRINTDSSNTDSYSDSTRTNRKRINKRNNAGEQEINPPCENVADEPGCPSLQPGKDDELMLDCSIPSNVLKDPLPDSPYIDTEPESPDIGLEAPSSNIVLPPIVFPIRNNVSSSQLMPTSYPNPQNENELGIALTQMLMIHETNLDILIKIYLFISEIITTKKLVPFNIFSTNPTKHDIYILQNMSSPLGQLVCWCLTKNTLAEVNKKQSRYSGSVHIANLMGSFIEDIPKQATYYPNFYYICQIMLWLNRPAPMVTPLYPFTFYNSEFFQPDGNGYQSLVDLMNQIDYQLLDSSIAKLYRDLIRQRSKFNKLFMMNNKTIKSILKMLYGDQNIYKMFLKTDVQTGNPFINDNLRQILLLYSRGVTCSNSSFGPEYFDWNSPVSNENPGTFLNTRPHKDIYWFPANQVGNQSNNTCYNSNFVKYKGTTDHIIQCIQQYRESLTNGSRSTSIMIPKPTVINYDTLSWPQLIALSYHGVKFTPEVISNLLVHKDDPTSSQRIAIIEEITTKVPLVSAHILCVLFYFPAPLLHYIAYELYGNNTLLYDRDQLIMILSIGQTVKDLNWSIKNLKTINRYHMLPKELLIRLSPRLPQCLITPPIWLKKIKKTRSLSELLHLFKLIPPKFGCSIKYLLNYLENNSETSDPGPTDYTMCNSGILFDMENHSDRVIKYQRLQQHPDWVVLINAIDTIRHQSDLLEDLDQNSYIIDETEQNPNEFPLIVLGYGTIGHFFPISLSELRDQLKFILNKEAITPLIWPRDPRVEHFSPLVTYQLMLFLVEHQQYYNTISTNPTISRIFISYFDMVNLMVHYQERLQINSDEVVKSSFEQLNNEQKDKLLAILRQVVRVGWRFRQWDGINEQLPLLASQTTNLTVNQVLEQSAQDTTHLMELIKQMDSTTRQVFNSLICYDFVSEKWIQGQIETLNRLIEGLFTTNEDELVCIRLGSNLLLYTGKYYMDKLFQITYDLTGLERIS